MSWEKDFQVSVQFVVSGSPSGEVKHVWEINEGRLVSSVVGSKSDAEIVISISWDDAVQIQQGALNPSVAFMQGRMKASGNMTKFLTLLSSTAWPQFEEWQQKLREKTEAQ